MGDGGFFAKPESWLAIVTAGTALVTIVQTRRQIQLSNKHQLFDRRLDKYKLVNEILDMYARNRKVFISDKENYTKPEVYLPWLMEISLFKPAYDVLFDDWSIQDQNEFTKQIDKLEKSAFEAELIWRKKHSLVFRNLIIQYCHLLKAMHNQYASSKRILEEFKKDYGQDFVKNGFEEYQKSVKENAEKNKLIESIQQFDKSYETIISEKYLDELMKQTKLYRR